MANVKLLFYGTIKTKTSNTSIECFCNDKNEISISITDGDFPNNFEIVSLDKPTAIKFSRELRKQIALID